MSPILILLALLSEWIYTQNKSVPWGLVPIYLEPRVGVLSLHETCVVVFRGTETIGDLFDDLMSQVIRSCSGDNILTVFLESYAEMNMTAVRQSVRKSACKKIFVTGHSLGGAMSEIVMKRKEFGSIDVSAITFGSPRTCCTPDEGVVQRIVNKHDPVAALPILDTSHCSKNAIDVPSFVRHVDPHWPPLSTQYDLLDHKISRYVKDLTEYINSIELKRQY